MKLNHTEIKMVRAQATSHISALHNWIATAIEAGEVDRAKAMVAELREYQSLNSKMFAALREFEG